MKKLLSLLLSILLVLTASVSLIACGDKGDDSGKTTINVFVGEGGLGSRWMKESAKRFEDKVAAENKSYADGKTGIKINVTEGNSRSAISEISTSGNAIIEGSFNHYSVGSIVGKGGVYNIDSWMTKPNPHNPDGRTIDSYIPDTTKNFVKATNENKYYAAPGYEWSGGLVYDIKAFDELGLYLAKEDNATDGRRIQIQGTTQFIKLINIGDNASKTVGRDGIAGTADDGMPTTLQNFAKLCMYMKKNLNMDPFTLPGQFTYHLGYFYGALWAALSSEAEMMATTEFRGEDIEYVVDGFPATNEDIFPSISSTFKVPQTATVDLKREANNGQGDDLTENFGTDGRYAFQTSARYYTLAFMALMQEQGLYNAADVESNTTSHTDVQEHFIFNDGDNRRAFLIDGTYMYNEAAELNKFTLYEEDTEDYNRVNEMGWYTLPATLKGPEIKEGEGVKQCIINENMAAFVVSARVMENPELEKATKDFFQFLFSEGELVNHTKAIGCAMGYDFTIEDTSDMTPFAQTVWNGHVNGKTIYQASDVFNKRYYANYSSFSTSCHAAVGIYYYPAHEGGDLYVFLKNGTKSLNDIFKDGTFTQDAWKGLMVPPVE